MKFRAVDWRAPSENSRHRAVRNIWKEAQMTTLEKEFRDLLAQFGSSLTAKDIEHIRELVDANELGIAFENFCTQLIERDATCSLEQLGRIAMIGTEMGINSDYWINLATTTSGSSPSN